MQTKIQTSQAIVNHSMQQRSKFNLACKQQMHFSLHLNPKTFNDFNITGLLLYSCFGQETFGIHSELNLSSSHCSLKI